MYIEMPLNSFSGKQIVSPFNTKEEINEERFKEEMYEFSLESKADECTFTNESYRLQCRLWWD